jgi:hypothetical protein
MATEDDRNHHPGDWRRGRDVDGVQGVLPWAQLIIPSDCCSRDTFFETMSLPRRVKGSIDAFEKSRLSMEAKVFMKEQTAAPLLTREQVRIKLNEARCGSSPGKLVTGEAEMLQGGRRSEHAFRRAARP